jgi:hypothetical protein
MNQSLALGWVYPGLVEGQFMQSVTDLLIADDARRLKGEKSRILRNGGTIGVLSGPRIASARNNVVSAFLKTQAEWLLMVDTDMVFKPEAVDMLFEAADPDSCPIVGGLCFAGGRSGIMHPTLYNLVDPETNDGNPIGIIRDYPDYGLCKVDATGAAFLLMHRQTMKDIGERFQGPYPWFAEGTVYKGAAFGEDWAFCLRAKSLEIPVHVHTGVKIGHVKPQILDEDAYRAYQGRRAEVGDEGIETQLKAKFGMEKV